MRSIRGLLRLPSARPPVVCTRVPLLLLAASVAACQGPPAAHTPPTVLTIGTSLPRVGDPSTGVRGLVSSLTLEAPIGIGWDGTPIPRAFDRWSWMDNGQGLRLHLRSGTTFHDGTPLTSQLAVRILQDALTPRNPAFLSYSVKSVRAEGDSEIVIRTGQPEGFLLSDIATSDFALPGSQIGTGPFVLKSQGPPIVLAAFERYRQGRSAIDRINIAEYDTQRAAWSAMMRDDINVLHDVTSDAVDFVEAESAIQTHSFTRNYYHVLVFNHRTPLFSQTAVRKALNEAVDRQQIVDLALKKRGTPTDNPVWPYHWAYQPNQDNYSYRPDAAGARLDAVGLTAGREHGPGRMPSRFRFTCLIVAEDPRVERIALVLQKQLFNISIDMDVRPVPLKELRRHILTGDYEAALTEFVSTRSLSFVYGFWHSPAAGNAGFFDSGYRSADAALDQLRAAISKDEVRSAVAAVQRAFYEDPPAVFLDWMETARALSRNIVVPPNGPPDILTSIGQWRPVVAGEARRQ